MDVSPFGSRVLWYALGIGILFTAGCGNRYDLSTERGRQARIDEANFQLSKGNCGAALEAIDPLYNSPEVDDEVRLVKASAHACAGTFNMLTLVGNLPGASNYLAVLAKSLANTLEVLVRSNQEKILRQADQLEAFWKTGDKARLTDYQKARQESEAGSGGPS